MYPDGAVLSIEHGQFTKMFMRVYRICEKTETLVFFV